MESLLNEITEVLLFLKITTYALVAVSFAWVIYVFRKIVGLDTHSIELRRIRRLLEQLAKGMGLDVSLDDFSDDDLDAILSYGIDGFIKQRSLIGTPDGCLNLVKEFAETGVDELCCLIDFVQDDAGALGSLGYLNQLKSMC